MKHIFRLPNLYSIFTVYALFALMYQWPSYISFSFLRQIKLLDGEDEYYQLLSTIEAVPEEEVLSGSSPNTKTTTPTAPPIISSRWAELRPPLWHMLTVGEKPLRLYTVKHTLPASTATGWPIYWLRCILHNGYQYLKGQFIQKLKYCHHLVSLILIQTCATYFVVWNI